MLIAGSLGVVMLARGNPATARRQEAGWTAALPDTVTFEPLSDPTADYRERLALLAAASRNTWGPEGNLSTDCYDFVTGGPEIILVEEGVLRVLVHWPGFPGSDMPEAIAPPTLFRAEEGHAPAYVEPNTQVQLSRGDVMVSPDGYGCTKFSDKQNAPVTFLEMRMLPGSPADPWISEDTAMTGEVIDIGSDVDPASPIVVGRLRIEDGGALPLEELGMPLALFLEEGEVTVNAVHDGMLARDVGFAPGDRTVWLASGQDVSLVPGNHVYIPGTGADTISATGEVSCLMVVLDLTAVASGG